MENSKKLEPLTGNVVIDDETKLVKKHYEYVISYAPTSYELDELLLKLSKLPYEEDTWYRILLTNDEFYTFSNPGKNYFEFKCNVEIIGVEKYYDKNGVSKYRPQMTEISYEGDLPSNPDDFILSSKNFGELYLSHINYDIISDSFVTKKDDGSVNMVYMLKACNGKHLAIQNCKFYDNYHGRITNIDVRDVDYIDISSNVLSSNVIIDSVNEGVNEGGNIWIRGGFKACAIIDNVLEHNGIDEMIGIIGGSFYNSESIFMSNLTIAKNTLNYGQSKIVVPNHKTITIVPGASKEYPNRKYYINHVYIGDNRINCYAPCYNTICIDCLNVFAEFNDVKIVGNIITRQSYTTNQRETDIFVGYGNLSAGTRNVNYTLPPVEIMNNQIIAKNNHEYVEDNNKKKQGDKYYIIRLNGTLVKATGNVIDTSKYNSKVTDKEYKIENSLLKLDNNGGEITFENNVITGVNFLGTISESDKDILDSQIRFIRNRIEYGHGLYCKKAKSIDLVMENNFYQITGYVMISQNYSSAGFVSIKNNTWFTTSVGENGKIGNVLFTYDKDFNKEDISLASVVCANNIFTMKYPLEFITYNLPNADCSVDTNNTKFFQ